jgi:hypothetical protein
MMNRRTETSIVRARYGVERAGTLLRAGLIRCRTRPVRVIQPKMCLRWTACSLITRCKLLSGPVHAQDGRGRTLKLDETAACTVTVSEFFWYHVHVKFYSKDTISAINNSS